MRESRKSKLDAWLRERAPACVEADHFQELLRLLSPIKESDLRKLLRQSGEPLVPFVEGVDQCDYPSVRRTLLALCAEYERGDVAAKRSIRNIVITAKDHAKLAQRNPKYAEEKAEMVSWMLTWLENPGVFPAWVAMRARLLKLD
ncbi:MAG: hypothetical protein FJW32_07590 [Acidobacteria bacterium]|nr:hypothetical protein [Acidobacteriota bacterium]